MFLVLIRWGLLSYNTFVICVAAVYEITSSHIDAFPVDEVAYDKWVAIYIHTVLLIKWIVYGDPIRCSYQENIIYF